MKRDLHRIGREWVAIGALAILAAACSGGPSVPASASASPGAFDLAKIEASVALVSTQGTFVTADGASELTYTGSGFVIDPSGLIVTNNHVVTGGAFWKVSIGADKTLLDAQLLGVSECSDLALLRVLGGATYPALTLAAADPTVGEQIYVAGHPNGDPYTLTNGIVAKPPAPADTSFASVKTEIQITAQTYPGNSGSPVVDAAGQVVGVHYAWGPPGTTIAGQSFAIAASEVKGIIDQIKAGGNLDYIGLNGEAKADHTGIAVVSVAPGSPADKAGIVAGDLLTNFNGTAVGSDGTKSTYCSVLRSHKSGDTLTVAVTRGGQTLTGEVNGRPIAVVATAAPATPAPVITPAPAVTPASSGSSGGEAIDRLQPYVPAAIWSTCRPYSPHTEATIVQGVACDYAGTDGVWYDLYGSSADLQAAIDAHVQNSQAKPSTDMATDCASGSWSGTWSWTGQGSSLGQDLLCAKNIDGIAYVQQADPNVNVLFIAQLKNGDQAAMYKWWVANTTLVEP
jgi:serine protease Do